MAMLRISINQSRNFHSKGADGALDRSVIYLDLLRIWYLLIDVTPQGSSLGPLSSTFEGNKIGRI